MTIKPENKIASLIKRFNMRYDVLSTGCWQWKGSLMPNGYGRIAFGKGYQYAHRVSWFIKHGHWPKKLICHHCDNRWCCNPDHLFSGTSKENTRDALQKDRLANGMRHGRRKLTDIEAREIKSSTDTQASLSKKYNVGQAQISRIKTGKNWNAV